ncbi:DUF4342 domain-containing protein [Sedimentibacter sp. MB31-C6]|uniref:DUF4342 domain-containing protein n=1 Tax=Sedimentibacter sp. MB31-C6 TaxID=3109366 RepID=UPI002DDD1499|nr:DUF4342 domain-containing protein [Sedimentibacter sp. MB36-C1]WSI04168.1 DUF4342 domain-containing protein [Sedimentibacter sp. MB36-C1]
MENSKLQKIDDIIKRTNTDYGTAKQALEDSNDDVLEAIILIENMNKKNTKNSYSFNKGEQILDQIKDVISKGNATKLTIKKGNETIINLPITAGLVGAIIAPFLSAAGITAALLTQCTVEITQADGKIIDVSQKVDKSMDAVKDAMDNVMDDVKQKTDNLNSKTDDSFTQNTDDRNDIYQ